MYNIRIGAFRWQIPTSYLMSIVMFALSLTVYEIVSNQEICQKFDLENEGEVQGVEERDLRHSTRNVGIHIGEIFQNLSYLAIYVYARGRTHNTHTHTVHIHTERQA